MGARRRSESRGSRSTQRNIHYSCPVTEIRKILNTKISQTTYTPGDICHNALRGERGVARGEKNVGSQTAGRVKCKIVTVMGSPRRCAESRWIFLSPSRIRPGFPVTAGTLTTPRPAVDFVFPFEASTGRGEKFPRSMGDRGRSSKTRKTNWPLVRPPSDQEREGGRANILLKSRERRGSRESK